MLREAFLATSMHRESFESIRDFKVILEEINNSIAMRDRWDGYTKIMPYANGITFEDTVSAVYRVLSELRISVK